MPFKRRVLSISRAYVALLALLALLPLLLLLALAVDALRRPKWVSLRMLAFGLWYLAVEAWMLPRLGATWLRWRRDPQQMLAETATLQQQFASLLFSALRWLFQMRLEVTGAELVAPGPVIVLVRHTSSADTLLPTVLLSQRHGMRLRFVLKRELLADPCLDIAGNRLPNLFVARDRKNAAQDLAAIRQLATGMGAVDGVLIYPEGTRFTPQKQQQALAALRRDHPGLAATAAQWPHVLPPKPGGVLAALAGAPEADVVWMMHTGLEGLADLKAIWRGGLVGQTVRVALRRTPRADVPVSADLQIHWLFAQWAQMNAWVTAQRSDTDTREHALRHGNVD